jgi:hypothetical protein
MFGARSVYFVNLHADDVQAFQLIDKNGVTRNPPNYQNFTVTNVVVGDRVAVFGATGTAVIKNQYNIKAPQGIGEAFVDVGATLPNDTPATGTVIVCDSVTGAEDVYAYTSWLVDRFTLAGVTTSAYGVLDTVYVPYIYEEAVGVTGATTSVTVTVIYVTDRDVLARVRKVGILPFETTGTFTSTGYSVAAIRTTDGIYTP